MKTKEVIRGSSQQSNNPDEEVDFDEDVFSDLEAFSD